jgi:hypothetical protein
MHESPNHENTRLSIIVGSTRHTTIPRPIENGYSNPRTPFDPFDSREEVLAVLFKLNLGFLGHDRVRDYVSTLWLDIYVWVPMLICYKLHV